MEKKQIYIVILLFVFILGCKTKDVNTQYRDDFRSISEKEKEVFLKQYHATSSDKSVLILTQGYKGEKITAKQEEKPIYSNYPITNLKTKLADYFAFSNESNLFIYDQFSKKEIVIPSDKAKKYKFIYLLKKYKGDTADFSITYSNTLRPLK
ncbi:conserved hypothetical protein [Flavobacterium sp. 9AF]|uniref:hypothetical protein n=1 Tax=Flavobacterium sp. 9AF TaxID=2653142 RepID=UPI0012F16F3A|nr:hypothetical protein [Flavobacterium sp. 9AF]VXC26944.1 conserved hypothetical protein [Flavobacterium sp. 9AF]